MGFSNIQNQDEIITIPASQPVTCSCIKSASSGSFDEQLKVKTEGEENNHKKLESKEIIQWCFTDSKNFIVLLLLGSISFASSGASIAWTSALTHSLAGHTEFISTSTSWMVSAFPLFAALATLAVFRWYHFSLKTWITVANCCITLSWIFVLLRQTNLYLVLVGRALAGFGTGTIYITISLYLSHFVKISNGIKIERTMDAMWILGALIQYLSSSSAIINTRPTTSSRVVKGEVPFDSPVDTNEWIIDIMMSVFGLIASIGFAFFAPDSPQTLVQRERYADARQLLEAYFKNDNEEIVLKMQCFTVEEVKGMKLKSVFKEKTWVERLVPVFGMAVFEALLGINVMLFYLQTLMDITGINAYSTVVKIMVFCVGLMFGAVIRLPLMCRTLSKSSFILSGTIIFIAFGVLGTFYHMQSLNLSFADDNSWLILVCLLLITAYYSGGITQNVRLYQNILTSNRNRFAVKTISQTLSWLTLAGISHKFNHAIWYIGTGWIYYNMALVAFFLMVFVLLLLPGVEIKSNSNIQTISNTIEGSDESRTTRSSSDASTDITMECALVV